MRANRARSVTIRCLALMLGAFLVGACRSEESRHARHLESAERYLAEEKRAEALIELRSALKLRPQDAETNFRIARLLEQQGSFLDAIFFYRETSRIDPERLDALLQEAKLLLQDDPERAEAIIQDLRERFPREPLVHVREAELALVRGDTDKALAAALTATEIAPRFSQGFHQLGIVHEARLRERSFEGQVPGDELFEAAIQAFRRADGLAEGSLEARVEIARIYAFWPDHQREAAEGFRQALALAKETSRTASVVEIARSAADLASQQGDQALRREFLREVVDAAPLDLTAWRQLARMADEEAEGSGEAVYRALLEKQPGSPASHIALAEYLVRARRGEEAFSLLDQAVSQGVEAFPLLESKLRLQGQLGLTEDREATLAQIQEKYPDEPETRLALARDALRKGRTREAAEALHRLGESYETRQVFEILSVAELRLQNFAAAAAAADRAVALASPSHKAKALYHRSNIAFAAGDWPTVVQIHQRLHGMGYPFRLNDLVIRAHCLYEVGRADAGRRLLEQALDSPRAPVRAAVDWDTREGAKDPERSYRQLLAAYEKEPSYPLLLRKIVEREVARGEAALALRRINEVLRTKGVSPEILLLRAELLAGSGDVAQAERDALRAFEMNPRLAKVTDLLVALYKARNKLDEVTASFAEAEQAGLLDASTRALLGRLYLTTGATAEARETYEKALAERADLPEAKNDLAYLLAKDGQDLDRALRLAQEAQQAMDREPSVADTVGFVYYRKGLHEAAVQQFHHALELSQSKGAPAPPEVHYHLGLALRALGREPEAAAAFEEVLRLDANFSEVEAVRRELEGARAASSAGAGAS